MRRFKLTTIEWILIYLCIALFVITGSRMVKLHYQVVRNAYTISKLRRSLERSNEVLEHLKVERSRIIIPEHLEQVAGRGGYIQPRQEQIILLGREEVSR